MMFAICEFRENRRREGRISLAGVYEITVSRVPWNRVTFWQ